MKRKPPEYRRFVEFGATGKPKDFLKGFLRSDKKGPISASLEVDPRKALMGSMTDEEFAHALKGPIATPDGGSMWLKPSTRWGTPPFSSGSTTVTSTPFVGTAVGSGWGGTTTGSGWTGSSTWSTTGFTSPWFVVDDLSTDQRSMVHDAICEEVRKQFA